MSEIDQTPKIIVLSKYPYAKSHPWADCWVIYAGDKWNTSIGKGATAALAWRNAMNAIRALPDEVKL